MTERKRKMVVPFEAQKGTSWKYGEKRGERKEVKENENMTKGRLVPFDARKGTSWKREVRKNEEE